MKPTKPQPARERAAGAAEAAPRLILDSPGPDARRCGGCARWVACPKHPRAGQFDRPGECRLKPQPLYVPGFGVENYPVMDAKATACGSWIEKEGKDG